MTDASTGSLRRTPLHDLHRELGARMVPFAGYEMPVQYTSIIEEHRTVRSAVGLFDLSHMGEIEVTGEEAVAFLRHALVSDPGALQVGQAQYSMLCDADGGIIDDLIVYRLADHRFLVVCNASNRAAVVEQLSALHGRADFDVELDDRSDATALVAPQGPRAAELLATLTDLDLESIGNYRAAEGSVAGVACLVARTGYTGEDGFELFCAAADAPRLWQAVASAGDPSPHGRAALQAVQQAGPARKLVGLRMVDNAIPRHGYAVQRDGETVGHVTSGTLSPTLGDKIAMALVPAALAEVGAAFDVVVRERPQRAEQVKLPFYRRPRD